MAVRLGARDLHEGELLEERVVLFEEPLDAAEALDEPLRVVHAIDADAEKQHVDAQLAPQVRAHRGRLFRLARLVFLRYGVGARRR